MQCLAMPMSGYARNPAGDYLAEEKPALTKRSKHLRKMNQRTLCFWNI